MPLEESASALNVLGSNPNLPKARGASTSDDSFGKVNWAELTIWCVLLHSSR